MPSALVRRAVLPLAGATAITSVAVILAPPASAATVELRPGPGVLQRAVDRATPGTTIRLHAGTYSGQVTVRRSGTAGAKINIQPAGDGPVTLTSSPRGVPCGAHTPARERTLHFDDGADNWTVSGLRIHNGVYVAAAGHGAVMEWFGKRVRSEAWQERRQVPGRGQYNPSAARSALGHLSRTTRTRIDPSDGISIIGNEITGRGLHVIASRYGVASGNRVHNVACGTGPGIWINGFSDGWQVRGNHVSDVKPSTWKHYMQEGIRVGDASSYNVVENNVVRDLPGDGRAFNTDVDASWNVFRGNTAVNVAIGYNDQMSGWGNRWERNSVEGFRTAGFSFRMMDANLRAPSRHSSTYRAQVVCNLAIGGGEAMQAGAIIESTFTGNRFATVQLSDPLRRYWATAGNRWNGSHAAPSKKPTMSPAGC